MSQNSITAYYAALLIKQYNGLPNASQTIQVLTDPVVMDELPTQVQNAFNLSGQTAVGVQLDVLGQYAGVSRNGLGTNGLPITLDDADFLALINLAIITNSAGSSLSDIQALLQINFAGEILVFDTQNMFMSYLVSTSIGDQDLIELFVTEGLLPKPMGVGVAVIAAPVIDLFFGMQTYALWPTVVINNTPLNSYGSYNENWPWLSYADAVTA